ncbi:hypothetical protein EIP86_011496 [Pleurotus ostreatoroseus]|nr:hypothetical protein EIP86_011496 [Pleurotus ostreatoroseus]
METNLDDVGRGKAFEDHALHTVTPDPPQPGWAGRESMAEPLGAITPDHSPRRVIGSPRSSQRPPALPVSSPDFRLTFPATRRHEPPPILWSPRLRNATCADQTRRCWSSSSRRRLACCGACDVTFLLSAARLRAANRLAAALSLGTSKGHFCPRRETAEKVAAIGAPKKDKKDEDEDDAAFKKKKQEEAAALKAARDKALKGGPLGGSGGIKKSGKK